MVNEDDRTMLRKIFGAAPHIFISKEGDVKIFNRCVTEFLSPTESEIILEYYGSMCKILKKYIKKLDRYGHDDDSITKLNEKIYDEYQESIKSEQKEENKPINRDHLYLIINTKTKHLKIGRSKNPKSRLKQLNIASPYKLELLFSIREKGNMEQKIHKIFSGFKSNSEWFEYNEDILSLFSSFSEEDPV